MAKIILPAYIESIHGRAGDTIFYTVAGTQYARAFTQPRNPRTRAQQKNRAAFSEGVKAWQKLSAQEKSLYNRLAHGKPRSGYNLFISMHMKGAGPTEYSPSARQQINVNKLSPSYMLQSTSVYASVPFYSATIYSKEAARGGNSPPEKASWIATQHSLMTMSNTPQCFDTDCVMLSSVNRIPPASLHTLWSS